ncbi:MAG TPA: toll/interleukin-1 receptor domain-containing protein, partial [Dehalococcoidia bacterium]|nr:toll/interleukin-1 receptor domain-containing protein [Dehalococcoidia bacterium]
EADLHKADLSAADLREANLVTADLSGANLIGGSLGGAALRGANLMDANLIGENLRGADLIEANLIGANLIDANLSGADLHNAMFGTVLGRCSLRSVKGLETCQHLFPSFLDFHTLASSGPLPLPFLRGCGLPDRLIEKLPSLLNEPSELDEPSEYHSCFISYSSKDEKFAQQLYADLQDKGVPCWFARKDLPIGGRQREIFDRAIQLHDRTLLILSKHSVASDWVEKEVETTFEKERKQKRTALFPIRIDNAVMEAECGWAADIRRTRHIGDFRGWRNPEKYQKALEVLLRDLRASDEAAFVMDDDQVRLVGKGSIVDRTAGMLKSRKPVASTQALRETSEQGFAEEATGLQ